MMMKNINLLLTRRNNFIPNFLKFEDLVKLYSAKFRLPTGQNMIEKMQSSQKY